MAFSWSSKPTSWISLTEAAGRSTVFRLSSATPVRPGRNTRATPHHGAQLIESRPCSEHCRRSVILGNGFAAASCRMMRSTGCHRRFRYTEEDFATDSLRCREALTAVAVNGYPSTPTQSTSRRTVIGPEIRASSLGQVTIDRIGLRQLAAGRGFPLSSSRV